MDNRIITIKINGEVLRGYLIDRIHLKTSTSTRNIYYIYTENGLYKIGDFYTLDGHSIEYKKIGNYHIQTLDDILNPQPIFIL